MDEELRKAIHHLLHIWLQYGSGGSRARASWPGNNGELLLDHKNMQAGEQASAFLERHGVGKDVGYSFAVNALGRQIMDDESLFE